MLGSPHARAARLVIFAAGLVLLIAFAILSVVSPAGAEDEGLFAEIHTSRGVILARLHYRQAPLTVMNFIGLADGSRGWADPKTGSLKMGPLYANLTFHNVKDFMVQTGDPTGEGTGGAGNTVPDEFDPELRHSKPGMLSMANRGPNTASSQFFITRRAAPWLDDHYTLFGEIVQGQEVVDRIEKGDQLISIAIIRKGEDAVAFNAARAHELSAAHLEKLRLAATKVLPETVGPVDPAKVPGPDQPAVSPGDFEFLVIGHNEIQQLERVGKVFAYDRAEALEIAKRLVEAARVKDADFSALRAKYSDMSRDTTTRDVEDSPMLPTGLKVIFHLKPGQISDPIDLPLGVYIFRRL